MTTIFSTVCTGSNIYYIRCKVELKCKNCDVAFGLSINGSRKIQHQFKAPSVFSTFDTIETLLYLNEGDTITIEACQNSGATVSAIFSYNYIK